jgi:hypothetical protein
MTAPIPRSVARFFQGHREKIPASCCLICRKPGLITHDERAQQTFMTTGICQICQDALDAWVARAS